MGLIVVHFDDMDVEEFGPSDHEWFFDILPRVASQSLASYFGEGSRYILELVPAGSRPLDAPELKFHWDPPHDPADAELDSELTAHLGDFIERLLTHVWERYS